MTARIARPLVPLLTGLVLALRLGAASETVTPDSVDVQITETEVVGIRGGGSGVRLDLQKRERVLWSGARGNVGVVLTDRRFLAFSTRSAGWREFDFGREDRAPAVQLGANLALCVTEKRVISFAGLSGLLNELVLFPGERVVSRDANEHAGAVVTDRRVLGFSSGSTSAAEQRFFVREQFESLRALATSVTVRTSERLLVYRTASGGWSEEDL